MLLFKAIRIVSVFLVPLAAIANPVSVEEASSELGESLAAEIDSPVYSTAGYPPCCTPEQAPPCVYCTPFQSGSSDKYPL